MSFTFKCKSCDELHHGMPSFGADAPAQYYWIPEEERAERVDLGSDTCIVDGDRYLVRGCIEIPVEGESEPFVWGVWVDLSKRDFDTFESVLGVAQREHVGPFAGYLAADLFTYLDTFNLNAVVHLRDNGIRPYVKISPSDHPLHKEQCQGITASRVAEIYALVMHGK
jgi:hypothetical protein